MGKGQLWPFAQSSPPGSHWGICGVVEDYSIAGIQLVTGCNRLGPRNRTFNRTRSSFPYGKNDQLFDNQPRRTRRPCPCRQLLPSVAGSGGGMPHGMRSRLDGVWTRARNIVVFPASFPARITPGWCEVRNSSFVAGFTENPSAPATLVTLLDTPAVPLCGLSAVFPAVWIPALVSLVLACDGASFAPTPRLLRASLPLRRYVRRGGVGTWPRGAVFPAFPVVHVCRLQKRNHVVNTKVANM